MYANLPVNKAGHLFWVRIACFCFLCLARTCLQWHGWISGDQWSSPLAPSGWPVVLFQRAHTSVFPLETEFGICLYCENVPVLLKNHCLLSTHYSNVVTLQLWWKKESNIVRPQRTRHRDAAFMKFSFPPVSSARVRACPPVCLDKPGLLVLDAHGVCRFLSLPNLTLPFLTHQMACELAWVKESWTQEVYNSWVTSI